MQTLTRAASRRLRWALVCSLALAGAPAASLPVTPGEANTWAFQPTNALAGGALDLRALNERSAGEHGFVRRSVDGNGYVRGDGQPLRFWGVAANTGARVSDADLARHARFLARVGVNIVRIGGAASGIIPQKPGCALSDVDAQFVTDVWRTVAAMKQEGIYTRVAVLWDHGSIKYISKDWGLAGYTSGDALNGLFFFESRLQQAYKAWMSHLMTTTNCFTGLPLKDDPALAMVQIISEDSLFFWWTDKIKGGPQRELQQHFGAFAVRKYGSLTNALAAWQHVVAPGDAPADGRLGLYSLWHITQPSNTLNRLRVRDQVEFMSATERAFYTDMKHYLKNDLGVRQLVTASNFGPADPERLGDLQHWDWTTGDALEFNQFFDNDARGDNSFWRYEAGHTFVPRSATRVPDLPCSRKQVAGWPFNISSTCWIPPNPYSAEAPLMMACYSAMNGVDGIFWFAAQAPAYDAAPYFAFLTIRGSHPMKRWNISQPGFLAQFPAAALIFRQQLVMPAATVVHEERTIAALLDRTPPLLSDAANTISPAVAGTAAADATGTVAGAAAYLIGCVEVVYGGDPARTRVANLTPFIDRASGEIRTTHGQLALNPAAGLLRINAPKAQGVVGFLRNAGGRFALADIIISASNDYAGIVAVPLDNQPLRQSRRILVQAGTIAWPTGWQTRPAGAANKDALEIVATGRMPWRMQNIAATLVIRNPFLTGATRLDEMGFAAGPVALTKTQDGIALSFPTNAVYLLLN